MQRRAGLQRPALLLSSQTGFWHRRVHSSCACSQVVCVRGSQVVQSSDSGGDEAAWTGRWRSPRGDRWWIVWACPDHLVGLTGLLQFGFGDGRWVPSIELEPG